MYRYIISLIFAISAILCAYSADPMSTNYSYEQCQGSLMPYPLKFKSVACPDTLEPVFINHVGRHGARFPASSSNCKKLKEALESAKKQSTITKLGDRLLELTDYVISDSEGRWGALDSLGIYEQSVIASRMFKNFRPIFNDGCNINAISSYSPRAMMSMYAFTHQIDRLNNHIEFSTTTGRSNSYLLRPFDLNEDFIKFINSDAVNSVYKPYFEQNCPTSAIRRVLGEGYKFVDKAQELDLALTEYYVLAGLSAMSVECDLSDYFTLGEINALWSCFNLRQYLQRTATTLSTVPADIAVDLLRDLIDTTDDYVTGKTDMDVFLRFGHAETLMPLLSLMHIEGCYYMTNYFDTVAKNWKDFEVVPMAANLQMILLYNPKNDKYYLRTDLNEQPINLIPNDKRLYVPWDEAKTYLTRCLPIHAQL